MAKTKSKGAKKSKDKLISFCIVALWLAVIIGLIFYEVSQRPHSSNVEDTPTATQSPLLHVLSTSDIDAYKLWLGTNNERTKAGLGALSLNPNLSASAQAKCDDMVTKNYWSHNSPDGQTPWHFMTDAGVPYIHLGENLGEGFHSAEDFVAGWMKSEEHRANILDPKYNNVGFAVCKSDNFIGNNNQPALVVVQHFAQL